MTVAGRLTWAFTILVALLFGLLAYHVRTLRDAVATSYELSAISSRLYLTSTELVGRIAELDENASKFWVTRDQGYLSLFNEASGAFEQALARLGDLALDGSEARQVEALAREWTEFLPTADRLVALADDDPDSLAVAFDRMDGLRMRAQGVSRASQDIMTERLTRSAHAAREAERLSWIAGLAALFLALTVSTILVRSISNSLNRLKSGTREVAEGNFNYRLADEGRDEFADVARDFNRMTRRLGELDQMKQDFVSQLSHDLKAPLASMRETNDILLEEMPGPVTDEQRELLALSRDSGQHLASMIAKLLDLSALEAGALAPRKVMREAGPMVEGVIERMRPFGTSRDVTISLTLPDVSVLLECDEDLMSQLVGNLLENSIKFSPRGARIEVEVGMVSRKPIHVLPSRWEQLAWEEGMGCLCLDVSDRGAGIPEDEREQIFERFFQGERGRQVQGRGVGLGLTICREIVGAHGGVIWAEGRRGGGTRVRVLLPGALRIPADVPRTGSVSRAEVAS